MSGSSLDETTVETIETTIERGEVEKQRGFAWNFHLAAVRNYAEGPKPSLDAEVK